MRKNKNHKTIKTLLIAFSLLLFFISNSMAVDYEIVKLGKGANCKWSPDGSYLAFTSSEGMKLYVADSGIVRTISAPEDIFYINSFNYDWFDNNRLLLVKREMGVGEQKNQITIDYTFININGTIDNIFKEVSSKSDRKRSKLRRLNTGQLIISQSELINKNDMNQLLGPIYNDTSAYYAVGNYSGWFTYYWGMERDYDVWLVKSDGSPHKRVTKDKTYGLVQLSPNGLYIMAGLGGVKIIDLDGKLLSDMGMTDGGSWLSDNNRVCYTRSIQDEEDIIASDIYINNIYGNNEIIITDTPNEIELKPCVSPDLKKIVYVNYKSDANYVELLILKEEL